MIIQINATVCGFLIMVRAGSSRSLAETSGRWCRKAREGGSYQAEQRIQGARQKCRFFQPMQNGVARRSSSLRE
jgi:hypothetical protein